MRSILKVISLQEYHSTMLAFNVSESQPVQNETVSSPGHDLSEFVPKEVLPLRNPQTDILVEPVADDHQTPYLIAPPLRSAYLRTRRYTQAGGPSCPIMAI